MISLAGLSAAYPGYQQAENTQAETQVNQAKAQDAALNLLAQHVAGRAYTAQPGQPMAPPPGQASVPSNPSPAAAPPGPAGAPPAASPTPAPAPSAPAGYSGRPPQFTLQEATQRILATSPQVQQHPELLFRALHVMMPAITEQGRSELADATQKFREEQLAQRKDLVRMQQEGMDRRAKDQQDAISQRAKDRVEVRLQDLDLKRQALEQRAQLAKTKEDRTRLESEAKVLHQKATEIIQAGNSIGFSDVDRKAMLDERKRQIDAFVGSLHNMGQAAPAAPAGPAAAPAPAPAEPKPAPTAIPAPPLPGFIKDGWKFKGGDPAKQESWERVGA